MRVVVPLIIFLALMSGCTSARIADGESVEVAVSELAVGDTVQVLTADGNTVRFTIEAIEDNELIGDGVRIPIDNIRTLSVQHSNSGEIATVTGSVMGLILGSALLAAMGL